MTLIGLLIIWKPSVLFKLQDPINKIHGMAPMSTQVRPIFVRFMGLVIIILAAVMFLQGMD